MAKRGETRPWRVRYEWLESGIKGCTTKGSKEEALRLAEDVRALAERTNRSVKVTVEHRGEPEQIVVSVAPDGGSDV